MRILVTGGSGFIGSHLTRRLVSLGHEVTITSSGNEPEIEGVKKVLYMGLRGIHHKYIHNQDVVFHQMANNDTRCTDEEEMFRANINGPVDLFDKAFRGGCKKFIYASSTAVYGKLSNPTETDPTVPLNVYAESKKRFDYFAEQFSIQGNVAVTGLRYCNVYGHGEQNKGRRMSMVGQILRSMLKIKQPKLFENGEQRRDWVHVEDVVQMNLLAMKHENGFRIYNTGSGTAYSFNDIVATINEVLIEKGLLKEPVSPEYIPCPFPDEYQSNLLASIEKAKLELGFSPQFDLRKGVENYLNAFSSWTTL